MTDCDGPAVSATAVVAIETSCDESAVAILRGTQLLASEVASQIALHQEYGGVVPEVASRNHLRVLRGLVEVGLGKARLGLSEVDAFAATRGPGLASSLMIGASMAKGLALGTGKPYLAINHIEGHLLSPFFGHTEGVLPAIALVVSGGHTLLVEIEAFAKYRLLGETHDDAAGEAFDKIGKLLGLPYPGGPNVDRLSRDGNPKAHAFPRSMISSGDDAFSFSGLKTAVRYLLPKLERPDIRDLCASFQEAIIDVLVTKTLRAALRTGKRVVAVSGGVSCNTGLRARFKRECAHLGLELLLAEPSLCTDNAAMIGYVAALRLAAGGAMNDISADIDPNLRLVV